MTCEHEGLNVDNFFFDYGTFIKIKVVYLNSKTKVMNAYQKIRVQQIETVLKKVRSKNLENFPATRQRLLDIVCKLQNEKPLSENDFQTFKLNEIPF